MFAPHLAGSAQRGRDVWLEVYHLASLASERLFEVLAFLIAAETQQVSHVVGEEDLETNVAQLVSPVQNFYDLVEPQVLDDRCGNDLMMVMMLYFVVEVNWTPDC